MNCRGQGLSFRTTLLRRLVRSRSMNRISHSCLATHALLESQICLFLPESFGSQRHDRSLIASNLADRSRRSIVSRRVQHNYWPAEIRARVMSLEIDRYSRWTDSMGSRNWISSAAWRKKKNSVDASWVVSSDFLRASRTKRGDGSAGIQATESDFLKIFF